MPGSPFTVSEVGGVTVIALEGEIDQEVGRALFQEVVRLLNDGRNRILLDLAGVTAIHSAGLGYLIIVVQRVGEVGGKFYLCSAQPSIRQLILFTAVDGVLKIFPDARSVVWD